MPAGSVSYAVVVLAGGAGTRLGGVDKLALDLGGRPLLDRILAGLPGSTPVVVVGPAVPVPRAVTFTREEPPGGGPVAALAAGLAQLREESVVLLGADMPFVAPAVPVLLAALAERPDIDGALLVDVAGREQPLAAVYRTAALWRRLTELGNTAGASLRQLLVGLALRQVRDEGGWALDCDTWEDLRAARDRWEAEHAR